MKVKIMHKIGMFLLFLAACGKSSGKDNKDCTDSCGEVPRYSEESLQKLILTKECENCNLSQADLSGLDLSGARLSGAILGGAKLQGTNLEGADLQGAYLSSLTPTSSIYADLSGANLKSANLGNANLFGANLSGADTTDAIWCQTKVGNPGDTDVTVKSESC